MEQDLRAPRIGLTGPTTTTAGCRWHGKRRPDRSCGCSSCAGWRAGTAGWGVGLPPVPSPSLRRLPPSSREPLAARSPFTVSVQERRADTAPPRAAGECLPPFPDLPSLMRLPDQLAALGSATASSIQASVIEKVAQVKAKTLHVS